MAKTYIFAIGGTGARVLRSLTMLMAAGFKDKQGNPFDGTICPIIIDYDEHNGDKDRAIESMKHYVAVHDLVMTGKNAGLDKKLTDNKKPFFTPKIAQLLPNWSWQFDFKNDQKLKFREYISYDDIGNYSRETQDFIECLYDKDNSSVYTELDLNMTQGFQGNPNIGSVVFDELKNCPEFTKFKNDFTQGDRIVIIGSIFGGTGSSGIPKIVSAIRDLNNPRNINSAEISVVLVLPYFMVETPQQGEISIKSNIFNSKTKAALTYYKNSGIFDRDINNIYFVGDKVPTRVEPHIGDTEQKNNAHIVEMISAMAILDLMTNPQNANFGNMFKFNASTEISDGIGLEELVGRTPNDWDNNSFVRNVIHGLINFTYMSRYFLDEIINPKSRMQERQFYKELHLDKAENKTIKSNNDSLPIQDYCAALYEFICKKKKHDTDDGYWQWLTELHSTNHGEHCLNIFNLKDGEICDLLHGKNFRSEPTTYGGITWRTEKPILTYDDAFDSEMNKNLMPYRQGHKKLEEQESKAYPWMFNHILYDTGETIRTFCGGDKLLPERFKLVP